MIAPSQRRTLGPPKRDPSFTIRGRGIAGYLVSGMYDDFSGGSLSHFPVEDAGGLGVVHVETARIAAIELRAEPGAVALTLDDGARLHGKAVRAWLVCPGMRVALGGATGWLDRDQGAGYGQAFP